METPHYSTHLAALLKLRCWETRMDEKGCTVTEGAREEVEDEQQVIGSATTLPTGSVGHDETARAGGGQSGGTLKSQSVRLWSSHDVSRYVQSLQRDFGEKASMYADTMVREDISGSVLLKLEDKDLKELGLSLGHRKLMLSHISAASKNLFL
jgi:hypothetical protein